MGFASQVMTSATSYLGYAPKQLSVDLAIEIYSDIRKYPSDYTSEMILADQTSNLAKITMAVAELDARVGIEGQVAHAENGMTRSYGNNANPKSYTTLMQIASF